MAQYFPLKKPPVSHLFLPDEGHMETSTAGNTHLPVQLVVFSEYDLIITDHSLLKTYKGVTQDQLSH